MIELIVMFFVGSTVGALTISHLTQRFYYLLEREEWNEYRKFINSGEPTLYRRKGE